ncbi:MFS general substrate transporter [Roridomyces roridus]|uniref:MFS general substrate transporter n=1 Tax=Roridomyces roridus TaxID=1738132 RepID=A0AAD7BUM1_9AGAR|nr:MFS general substrate transporter [Roridomyces roridus]
MPPEISASRPVALQFRSSYWFVTAVIGLGIATDLFVYSLIIPVIPFQLERLHYQHVSGLTGLLLFANAIGMVIFTVPVAIFSERYNTRRSPLIAGLILLIGSQALFMEAPNYPGFGSTMVWVIGLALLCDSTPAHAVGTQLGFAMSGFAIGFLVGPPIGGAIYKRFGFRGPFDALRWGVDPAAISVIDNKDGHPLEPRPVSTEPAPADGTPPRISLAGVIGKLSQSTRAIVVMTITLFYGIIYSAQEPTLPLHLQKIWKLDSSKVGLVYLAGVLPTLVSSPLSGFFVDRHGVEWPTVLCIAAAIPWWALMVVQHQLPLFIVAYALGAFCISGVISPVMAEFAAVARGIDGVGCEPYFCRLRTFDSCSDGHVYGAFNLVYGIGTSLGPILGGQIYTHSHGWEYINICSVALLFGALIITFAYTGDRPLLTRFV